MRSVALYMPDEAEIDLLHRLQGRADVRVAAVIDPSGAAPGTSLAAAAGVPVHPTATAASLPTGTVLVGDADRLADLARLDSPGADRPEVMTTGEFLALLTGAPPTPAVPDADPIRRSLDRIDRAQDRDAVADWLLTLAMRAVDADGGSLLLRDHLAGELYVAAARGLGDEVRLRARQSVGEGPAGRVARERRSLRLDESPEPPRPNARGALASAICVPLCDDQELVGVLNVSNDAGRAAFTDADQSLLDGLAPRLARILRRAGDETAGRDGLHARLARQLAILAHDPAPVETVLAGWAGTLALELDAENAALAVVRDDGSLLVAEAAADGETRVGAAGPEQPAWMRVLDDGRPLIARQASAAAGAELTLHFLPVGAPRPRAVLATVFASAAEAHRFRADAEPVVALLARRLPDLLERHRLRERLRRQRELLDLLAADPAPDALTAAAARLLGARHVYRVGGSVTPAAPPPGWDPAAWPTRLQELLRAAAPAPWLATTLEPGPGQTSDAALLAVPADGDGARGLVLVGKVRTGPLGAAAFDEFDGELARRLSTRLFAADPASATPSATPPARRDDLESLLRLEMDRADRYHVSFSVSVFRLPARAAPTSEQAAAIRRRLRAALRSTDTVTMLPDDVLAVVAPEETHAVSRLEQRVVRVLREVLDDPDLDLRHGRAIYPGPDREPRELLARARASLDDA